MRKHLFDRTLACVCAAMYEGEMPVSPQDVLGRSRKQNIVTARHMVCLVMRKHYDKTLQDIGRTLGKDHASVIHGCNTMTDILRTEWRIADAYKRVVQLMSLKELPYLVLAERPIEEPEPDRNLIGFIQNLAGQDDSYVVPMMWTREQEKNLKEWRKSGESAFAGGFAQAGAGARAVARMSPKHRYHGSR